MHKVQSSREEQKAAILVALEQDKVQVAAKLTEALDELSTRSEVADGQSAGEMAVAVAAAAARCAQAVAEAEARQEEALRVWHGIDESGTNATRVRLEGGEQSQDAEQHSEQQQRLASINTTIITKAHAEATAFITVAETKAEEARRARETVSIETAAAAAEARAELDKVQQTAAATVQEVERRGAEERRVAEAQCSQSASIIAMSRESAHQVRIHHMLRLHVHMHSMHMHMCYRECVLTRCASIPCCACTCTWCVYVACMPMTFVHVHVHVQMCMCTCTCVHVHVHVYIHARLFPHALRGLPPIHLLSQDVERARVAAAEVAAAAQEEAQQGKENFASAEQIAAREAAESKAALRVQLKALETAKSEDSDALEQVQLEVERLRALQEAVAEADGERRAVNERLLQAEEERRRTEQSRLFEHEATIRRRPGGAAFLDSLKAHTSPS